jgi:hypothetical protein
MKCAKFFINHSDPAYPKITRFKGHDVAEGDAVTAYTLPSDMFSKDRS